MNPHEAAADAQHQADGSFYFAGGAVWMLADAIKKVVYDALPPWSVVPPLIFAVAAVWNARTNALRARREAPR